MTSPNFHYHDYESELGSSSPVDQAEWNQFFDHRKQLMDSILGTGLAVSQALNPEQQAATADPAQALAGAADPSQPPEMPKRPPSAYQLGQASFWGISKPETMDAAQLEAEIERRRSDAPQEQQTTAKSAVLGLLAGTAAATSSAAQMTENLFGNLSKLPFAGPILKSLLYDSQSKAFLDKLQIASAGAVEAARAGQPASDRGAFDFLTAAGKMAGYALPAVVAWEGVGAALGGVPSVPWLARGTTPFLRAAAAGGISGALLGDPDATPGERAFNIGFGALMGGSSVWGRAGASIALGGLGAGLGQEIGATPEERRQNMIRWGIGGAILPVLAPVASRAFAKVFGDLSSAAMNFGAIPADQSGMRPAPGEDVVVPEYLTPQISGNPPKLLTAGGGTQPAISSLRPTETTPPSSEDIAALIRTDPTMVLGADGTPQIQAGGAEAAAALPSGQPRALGAAPAVRGYLEPPGVGGGLDYGPSDSYDSIMMDYDHIQRRLTDPQYNALYDPQRGNNGILSPEERASLEAQAAETLHAAQAARYTERQRITAGGNELNPVSDGPAHLVGSKVSDSNGKPLRVYHGTSAAFDTFDPTMFGQYELYGPGIYHTEAPDIASGYTGVPQDWMSNPLASTNDYGNPNVRPAFLDIKNPLRIDHNYSMDEAQQLISRLEAEHPEYRWDTARMDMLPYRTSAELNPAEFDGSISGEHLYGLLSEVEYAGKQQGPVQHNDPWYNGIEPTDRPFLLGKAGLNAALQDIGYDGITHIGGALTDNPPHRVWIAFSPDQVHPYFETKALDLQAAAEAANGVSKQATVMESSTLPDIVGKTQLTDADVIDAAKANSPGTQAVVRDIGRPLDVLTEHPDVRFVERSVGMTSEDQARIASLERVANGLNVSRDLRELARNQIEALQAKATRVDALIGNWSEDQIAQYNKWGTYEGNIVVAASSGTEGEVLKISPKGVATLKRTGGGPPVRVRVDNLLPSRYGEPQYNGPDLWNSFKADLLHTMNEEAQKANMAPVESLWDVRVASQMQSHLEDYLDRRGITDQGTRFAIDRAINSRWVEEARDLDPEARDIQAAAGDRAIAAANEDEVSDLPLPVSIEEKAQSRGFIWITAAGKDGGVLRDNLNPEGAFEVPIETDAAAEEFLRTVDRTLPDLTPASDIPADVMETAPTDTTIEPRLPVEEHADLLDQSLEDFQRRWEAEQAADVEAALKEARAAAAREQFRGLQQEATAAQEQMYQDALNRGVEDMAIHAPGVGGPPGPPTVPPHTPPGALPGPEPAPDTLGAQFARMRRNNFDKLEELRSKFSHNLFRYTRYLMSKVERELVKSGITLGRAWRDMEALETAHTQALNHAQPWLKEWGEIMREFPQRLLREGHVTRIHEFEDPAARAAAYLRLQTKYGFSNERFDRMLVADARISDFMHRWFEFLTEDPAFSLTAEREIFRYMPHVRARQATGAPDPFDSRNFLSPNMQYFAEFAREGNVQFRIMDARELGSMVIRAGMFKKYEAAPWENLVRAWQDPRVPPEFQKLMLGHAHLMRYGYDSTGDLAIRGVQGLAKLIGFPVTKQGAARLLGIPMNGMYMSKFAGRPSVFFRDAIQPLMALAKVNAGFISGTYADVIGSKMRDPAALKEIYKRGLEGGWVIEEQPAFEAAGAFETGARDYRELSGLTPRQKANREMMARISDVTRELPDWLVRPSESTLSTIRWYAKEQKLNRLIVGESAFRQATTAINEFRRSQVTAAIARDPSQAMSYEQLANRARFSSFEEPIANRLKEHIDAGNDEEAAKLFAREVANWSQFKYGRRENPQALRGTTGRFLAMFGSFTGQFLEGVNSVLSNGTAAHRARAAMVLGGISWGLYELEKETGWKFGKWAWTGAVKYAGGPGVEMLAKAAGAFGGTMALSDDRKPSPFQQEVLNEIGQSSPISMAANFFPYTGYIGSAAELSAAMQGTNPIEQAARYTITGERGSASDFKRIMQQNVVQQLIHSRNQIPGALPDKFPPAGPTLLGHPGIGGQQ